MVDKSIENVIYGMEPSERQEQDVAWTAVPSPPSTDLGYTHFATLAPTSSFVREAGNRDASPIISLLSAEATGDRRATRH